MKHEVFTAGIESGGLTTDFEIRILICWLLWKLKTPLSVGQLNASLQQKALVNYFELTRTINMLIKSGHLELIDSQNINDDLLKITYLGEQTALTFEANVPFSVREKALQSANRYLKRERNEKENDCIIEEISGGYLVKLTIRDVGSDLLRMELFVPNKELGDNVRDNFLDDPTVVYRAVISALTGEIMSMENDNFDEQIRLDI